MAKYEIVLHAQAWAALVSTKGAGRRLLLTLLEQLAEEPFRRGDFRQLDLTGRTNEVALQGEWLITFWSDHAAREVRVVALERVDDGG